MASLRKLPGSSLATELDGELLLIHAETGKFFALKDTGFAIWRALDHTDDLTDICARLQQDYAVDPVECRDSVSAFADELVKAGFAEYC